MLKLHHRLKNTILNVVDFFYPLFKRFMPLQTYRYAACGGANTALGIVLYFIGFHYVYPQPVVHLPLVALSNYIAAEYLFAIWFTFPIGFYLSRYVVFPDSALRRRVQLFRYFLTVTGSILLNYLLLKLFIEHFLWYPTLSKMAAAIFVITFSYLGSRYFSFRKPKEEEE